MGRIIGYFFLIIFLTVLGLGGFIGYKLMEDESPHIEAQTIPPVLGKKNQLNFSVSDLKSGLRDINISIIQNGKRTTLISKNYPITELWRGSQTKKDSLSIEIMPLEIGLNNGSAILKVEVRDASLRNGIKGNKAEWQTKVLIDTMPPQIIPLSIIHNISQGGSGLVSYKINEPPLKTGIIMGKHYFPGYPRPGGEKGEYAAMVAVSFNEAQPFPVYIEAVDQAGNRGRSSFHYRILKKKFKRDKMNISDNFLNYKMPDFTARYPELKGSLLDIFIEVNTHLRKANNETIRQLCKNGDLELHWQGPFLPLPRSKHMAGFGEYRTYYYKDRKIGNAVHLGTDLASTSHAPVPAGNTGIVVFADYLGIYGNTIILDHGLGLFSLYAHLNNIVVSKGAKVHRGDIIGYTGNTGLAGGDHLHFGMLINGVFVNPVEWWDGKWIESHILSNLSAR